MTPDARRLAGSHLSEESAYAQAKRDMHAARAAAIEASAGPDDGFCGRADARKDDAAARRGHLHLLLRAAAHDQERHRQARGPGPRPVARPLLLGRSLESHDGPLEWTLPTAIPSPFSVKG